MLKARWRTSAVSTLVLVALTAGPARAARDGGPAASPHRVLVVEYEDGRIMRRVLHGQGGGAWTPYFPGKHTAPSHAHLPLAALEFRDRPDGDAILVQVALLYGRPHQERIEVARFRLVSGDVRRVTELTAHGVPPIAVSLESLRPALAWPPQIVNISSQLELAIEPVSPEAPLYRLRFMNRSDEDVMAVSFRGFRGEDVVFSGRRKADRNEPLIAGRDSFEYVMPASVGEQLAGGEWVPLALDRFELTGVLWADGVEEGDGSLGASERGIAIGRAAQLARVIELCRRASMVPARAGGRVHTEGLAAALDDLPVEPASSDLAALRGVMRAASDSGGFGPVDVQFGRAHVRSAAREDLAGFAASPGADDPEAFQRWLAVRIRDYEQWLARARRQAQP